MDTLENMKKAIDYIESNLDGEIEYERIAKIALCSQYHFQRMFGFLIGVPLSEYIRRRRLTLAAFDLQNGNEKIIDIALKYGYNSPDSFSRAFMAMHEVTPSKAREKGISLKAYPRVTFTLSIKGVVEMNYRIEQKKSFTVVGIKERFSNIDGLGENVGKMWSETPQETISQIAGLGNGLVGVYSGMYEDNTTDYYIASITEKDGSETMCKLEIPSHTWAIFDITGPMPTAMAEIWGRIFSEWFPTSGYEHAEAPEVEWYSNGDLGSSDYKSEIWIPVIKK
ncbi:AraC family transcriptional regulator [Anaerocolumna chitinilytica]|uniref:Putative HTH-type transcriptional regulator YdeE n=1 Tax=Anaerocolumna chitinilytica TaxID=1727145 RepID=A0A7M3S966_9FIRM|nr:AraC family transcriptional regulator [Anaerocolumna chitinilytica]BCK01134.1 putative HTH-type transcriptional regulator YdeE [Anaerocolumna chitinilytica]